MARLGILGGTFDPPHIAHLILAELAVESLGLSRLLFVPAADPPHKSQEARMAPEHRVEMVRLAISDNPHFGLSRLDVDRPGPHFSVDMVQLLQGSYLGDELYFVMGGDSFADLPRWRRPQQLIQMCWIGVVQRPGDVIAIDMHEHILPGLASRTTFIEAPILEISSSEIVDRLQQGQTVRYMMPDPVLEYISRNRLYVRRAG